MTELPFPEKKKDALGGRLIFAVAGVLLPLLIAEKFGKLPVLKHFCT